MEREDWALGFGVRGGARESEEEGAGRQGNTERVGEGKSEV